MVRAAVPEDFLFVYHLYMDESVNPFLLYEPMTEEEFAPVYEDLLSKGIKFIYLHEGIVVGMYKLVRFTYRSAHVAYLGGVAIHPAYAGQGHGEKMLTAMLEQASSEGILRIELTADTFNDRAIKLYRKLGFREEGVLKKYTYLASEKKYLDEVLMAHTGS